MTDAARRTIPTKHFRLTHGYGFDETLSAQELGQDNIVIGATATTAAAGDVEATYIGRLAEFERMKVNVWMDLNGAHAVYVLGKRRSGKTFTLGGLAEGLVSSQWIRLGQHPQAILILDTMNVFLTMPHTVISTQGSDSPEGRELSQWGIEDEVLPVRLYYPKGSPRPPEGDPVELAIRPGDLSADDWAALFGVDVYSDPQGQLISEVYDKVTVDGYRVGTNPVRPNQQFSIDDLLRCIAQDADVQRYEARTIEAVRRRLRAIDRLGIFSQSAPSIRDVFVRGQISVVLLRDLDHEVRGVLIATMVKKILEGRSLADRFERLASVAEQKGRSRQGVGAEDAERFGMQAAEYRRKAAEGLPRGWLIIDEAHNYVPARGTVASRMPLRKYINEGRNLGLSIVVATQQPSGLDPAIQRNADILIIHSMSMRDDIQTTEGMVNTFVPESVLFDRRERITSRTFERLVRSLDLGYALVSNDRVSRIFPLRIRPRITVHGGKDY